MLSQLPAHALLHGVRKPHDQRHDAQPREDLIVPANLDDDVCPLALQVLYGVACWSKRLWMGKSRNSSVLWWEAVALWQITAACKG